MEGVVVMKKVSFRVRNFDKEQFLTYDIDNEAELDEEVLDFLEEEEPGGIVPIIFEDEGEEFDTFSYNVTDKIRLNELSNQEINAEMVLMVMRGIVLALIDMAEYRIPLSYLVLHRNYIYIDSEYKVEFICIPLEEMQEKPDVNSFLRQLIASLRFDPSENGDYVAKLLTYVNDLENFNLHNLLTLIEELMDNYGIEIPEDNDSGIYVDYQEVKEEENAVDIVEALDDDMEDETSAEDKPEENDFEEEESETWIGDTTILRKENDVDADGIEEDKETDIGDKEPEESNDSEDAVLADDENDEDEAEELAEDSLSESDETIHKELEDEAQEIVDKLKKKVIEETQKETESDEEENDDKKKEIKKPIFKTKDTSVTGVVIQDDFDDFLAEKEKEEQEAQEAQHEETGLKIKKNIKVSRASIVKNTQEERKAEEEAAEAEAEAAAELEEDEEAVSNSILSQTIGSTGILKGSTGVPKVNPYLVRVNTDERIMITKQNFKIGKASMGVDYTVQGNSAVSRVHAIITNKDGIYYVKDNKSTNHTFVNGKILNDGENALLTHDSRIVLGDEEFVFKLR